LGQEVASECIKKYEEMTKGNFDFVVYGMDEKEENIIVTDSGKISGLIESLPSNDCRYVSFKLNSKIIFLNWAPDTGFSFFFNNFSEN
jgi:hypothetical protein